MRDTDRQKEETIGFNNGQDRLNQNKTGETQPLPSLQGLLEAAEIVQEIMNGKL
jgi:hypothetical protein